MTSAQQAERQKFLANFLGNAAIVIFAAGILAPLADSIGLQPTGNQSWGTAVLMVSSLFSTCFLTVIAFQVFNSAVKLETVSGD